MSDAIVVLKAITQFARDVKVFGISPYLGLIEGFKKNIKLALKN